MAARMTSHLIIPDSHSKPGVSNERYTWLGKFIVDTKPDVVVNIGDWADMHSLSSYDRGKREYEGRRYKHDIAAANDALDRVHHELKKSKSRYKPRMVSLIGNHEVRINRATSLSPELDGLISTDDIQFKQKGWEVYDFLDIVQIDGIYYSHYFTSGLMGRAISGETPASTLLKKHFVSCIAGHNHLWDFAQRTRPDNRRILGMTVGWYGEHKEAYANGSQHMWWSGLTTAENVENGNYDPHRVSISRIKKEYK